MTIRRTKFRFSNRRSFPRRRSFSPVLRRLTRSPLRAQPHSIRSLPHSIRSPTYVKSVTTAVPNIIVRRAPIIGRPKVAPRFQSRRILPRQSTMTTASALSSTSPLSSPPTTGGRSPAPLMPTRAILACDENYKYIQFWEPVALHWKQVHGIQPTLFFIAPPTTPINQTIGDVIFVPPIPGVPSSLIAQCIRLLGPSMFPDDVCVICDMDLFLLDRTFFSRYLLNIPADHFVSLNRYTKASNVKRMSMCYQVAKGRLFGELFNCNGGMESIMKIMKSWIQQSSEWGTDEKILTRTLHEYNHKHPNKWHQIHTPFLWGAGNNARTISRYHKNSTYDANLLERNHYIEFEPPRSLMENYDFVKHILESAIPNFVLPTISYQGKNTGPSRHPADAPRSKFLARPARKVSPVSHVASKSPFKNIKRKPFTRAFLRK